MRQKRTLANNILVDSGEMDLSVIEDQLESNDELIWFDNLGDNKDISLWYRRSKLGKESFERIFGK